MQFDKILIEKRVKNNIYALSILQSFPHLPLIEIDCIDDIFGRVKKPYLQKKQNLSILVGEKHGELVKKAPFAYGFGSELHYYYIHSYNCIYECEYCYLQGYFNSPDLVFFVNHQDIIRRMEFFCRQHHSDHVWFHAGEYSDSLATSTITKEFEPYWNFFSKNSKAFLELRTKSSNIGELMKKKPLENVFVSFSLAPSSSIASHDLGTPPLKTRLIAMRQLAKKGYQLAIHLDPIIYSINVEKEYEMCIETITSHLDIKSIKYISLGVVRFSKKVFSEVKRNYPDSALWLGEWGSVFEGKRRYPRPFRLQLLKKIKALLVERGFEQEIIYLCME